MKFAKKLQKGYKKVTKRLQNGYKSVIINNIGQSGKKLPDARNLHNG